MVDTCTFFLLASADVPIAIEISACQRGCRRCENQAL